MGQTLTATSGTWTPSDGTYAYQWLAGGSPIVGATTSSYTVVAGDVGKTLSVRVTASQGRLHQRERHVGRPRRPSPGRRRSTNTALPTISDTTPDGGVRR